MNLQSFKFGNALLKSPRPPAIINIVLLLALAWWLAPKIWNIALPPSVVATSNPVVNTKPTIKNHAQQIAALHVFGSKPIAAAASAASPKTIPVTSLNLVLKGVLANNPQQFAYALVAEGSAEAVVYAIGEQLPGGAELREVYADRIIINYNNRDETLMLQELDSVDLGSISPAVAPSSNYVDNSSSQASIDAIDPQRANSLRKEFLANPTKLLQMVSIKPYMQNGKVLGYRINPKGDPALYNELGLKPNDVVISVNNISITDIGNINKLASAAHYDVMILRQGQQIPLSLNFQ